MSEDRGALPAHVERSLMELGVFNKRSLPEEAEMDLSARPLDGYNMPPLDENGEPDF